MTSGKVTPTIMESVAQAARILGATLLPNAWRISTMRECSRQAASITCRFLTLKAGLSTTVAIMSAPVHHCPLQRWSRRSVVASDRYDCAGNQAPRLENEPKLRDCEA